MSKYIIIPVVEIEKRIADLIRQGEIAEKEECFKDVEQIIFEIAAIQETVRRGKEISLDEKDVEEMSGEYDDYSSMAREFARLHVEAALKAVNENVEYTKDSAGNDMVDKDSILNAYPLTNII